MSGWLARFLRSGVIDGLDKVRKSGQFSAMGWLKRVLILVCGLHALVVFAEPRDEAASLIAKYRDTEAMTARLNAFSSEFLGLPYGTTGPLGEGLSGRYDQDPLYRFDTFDCTTFVETVVSLSLSTNVDAFETSMNRIRYEGGEVEFLKRNHFPSLQWIPNNLLNGIFEEANSKVLPDEELSLAEAMIDIGGWLKKSGPGLIQIPGLSTSERTERGLELQGQADRFSPVRATLKYLPIARLLRDPALLRRIPDGAIINFVRPNWDLIASTGTRMNVSHQGLVFNTSKGIRLRHASVSGEKRVMEVSLLTYLKAFENHPTMKGIHLLTLRQSGL